MLSFLIIGIYWANHHSFMRLFARTDHYFLMLNVLFLILATANSGSVVVRPAARSGS